MLRGALLGFVGLASFAIGLRAEPLSKKIDIDFFRDVPSRNLKGLATRSDGRLVAGPTLTEFTSAAPAELLWWLEPTTDPAKFLLGTGPEGKIIELTLNATAETFSSRDVVKLDDPQVFTVRQLADGTILAGTSPKGVLYLIRDGKPVARVALPVDSIFDLLLLDPSTALVATGNPGRIYRVDLKKFATDGIIADKITDAKILADRGVTLLGEVRDRNVRRLAAMPDGRIAAGSAPKGNVYLFPTVTGTAKSEPMILQENRDAEVTDLLPQPNGDLFATVVFSSTTGDSRITPLGSRGNRENRANDAPKPDDNTPPPAQVERFGGRSTLVWFPANGFAETLTARPNTAFYRMARRGDLIVIAGGEQGELLGYDVKTRLALTFAGSASAQVNGMVPLPPAANAAANRAAPARFLLLRNNAPGLALLDFDAPSAREAETRRIDLSTPAQLGALRFNRLRDVPESALSPAIRTSNGSDEVEGWGPWTTLQRGADGGWRADNLRGRYVKLRLKIADAAAVGAPLDGARAAPANDGRRPATPLQLEIDRATIFALPQNRRPVLQDFRVLTPGYGVVAAVDQPPSPVVSLSQLIQGPKDDDRHKGNFLSSQVVPSPGTQVVLWTVNDPDGDNLLSTFSIRRDGESQWTDVVANTKDSYAQFDTAHLPDGIYFTRLVATETAPRPPADRLSQTFETDDLVIDHTPPEIIEATAKRNGDSIVVTVHGRDQLSLLDGVEVVFNNNVHETLEQPVDGVRDGREETFSLDVPLARVSNATSVEVTLYDAAGNGTARRLTW
jgi:hypothetical protein